MLALTVGRPPYNTTELKHPMPENNDSDSFDQLVEWAYGTLPQEVKDLPDFPGIQVLDEPPDYVLQRQDLPKGHELLGLYSGVHRTEPQHLIVRMAPDLIFVFRGPILRCSRGDLRAEVKGVVWHEVAHWLGLNEERARTVEDTARRQMETYVRQVAVEAPKTLPDIANEASEANEQQPRCIKCYSADITCREGDKPAAISGALLGLSPVYAHTKSYSCNSCGYEWNDQDDS
jgi:predicted Zn-dependent protease with MMP-like domain